MRISSKHIKPFLLFTLLFLFGKGCLLPNIPPAPVEDKSGRTLDIRAFFATKKNTGKIIPATVMLVDYQPIVNLDELTLHGFFSYIDTIDSASYWPTESRIRVTDENGIVYTDTAIELLSDSISIPVQKLAENKINIIQFTVRDDTFYTDTATFHIPYYPKAPFTWIYSTWKDTMQKVDMSIRTADNRVLTPASSPPYLINGTQYTFHSGNTFERLMRGELIAVVNPVDDSLEISLTALNMSGRGAIVDTLKAEFQQMGLLIYQVTAAKETTNISIPPDNSFRIKLRKALNYVW